MRGLKVDLGLEHEGPPGSLELPLDLALAPAPLAPAPLVRALENQIARVASGAPSTLAIALADGEPELRATLDELRATTRPRALHASFAGLPSPDAAAAAFAAALLDRTPRPGEPARPGAATLLDPLVAGAAGFVLGAELPAIAAYLEPAALDETPAVAARLLLRRFVPAFAAQLPAVPVALLEALVRARCAGPDEAPGLADVAAALGAPAFLAALGAIAARGRVALVLALEGALESAAATVAHALELRAGTGLVLVAPAVRATWVVQSALLSEDERRRASDVVLGLEPSTTRVETARVEPSPTEPLPGAPLAPEPTPVPPPSASGVTPAPPPGSGPVLPPRQRIRARHAASATGAGPPIPLDEALRPAFQEDLRRAVAERLGTTPGPRVIPASHHVPTIAAQARAALGPESAEAVPPPPAAIHAPDPEPDPRLRRAAQVVLAGLPFVFLASLLLLGRRDPEADRGRVAREPDWTLRTGAVAQAHPAPGAVPGGRVIPGSSAPARPYALTPPPPAPANAPPLRPRSPGAAASDARHAVADQDRATAPSLESRLSALERTLPGIDPARRTEVLLHLLDEPPGPDGSGEAIRLYAIDKLGSLVNMPGVAPRFLAFLDTTHPRGERLAAVGALARAPLPLAPDVRARLTALAAGDDDASVEAQARAVLAAAGEAPAPAAQAAETPAAQAAPAPPGPGDVQVVVPGR